MRHGPPFCPDQFIGGPLMGSVSHLTTLFFRSALLLTLVLALGGMHLEGHAILKSSSPANGGSVTRADTPVQLTFNVRVDAARSKLQLVMPDASIVELPLVECP